MKKILLSLLFTILSIFSIQYAQASAIDKNYEIVKNNNNTQTLFINGKEIATYYKIVSPKVSRDGEKYYFIFEEKERTERKTMYNGQVIDKYCYLGDETFDSLICYEEKGFSYKGKTYSFTPYGIRFYEPTPFVLDGDLWYFAAENFRTINKTNKTSREVPTSVGIYKNGELQFSISLGKDGEDEVRSIKLLPDEDRISFFYYKDIIIKNNDETTNSYRVPYKNKDRFDPDHIPVGNVYMFKNNLDNYFYVAISGEKKYLVKNGKRVSKGYDDIDNIIVDESSENYYFEGVNNDGSRDKISNGFTISDYNWEDIEYMNIANGASKYIQLYEYPGYGIRERPNIYDITNIDSFGYTYEKRKFIKNGETIFTADKDIEEILYLSDNNDEKKLVYTSTDGTGYVALYDTNNNQVGITIERFKGNYGVDEYPITYTVFYNNSKYDFSIYKGINIKTDRVVKFIPNKKLQITSKEIQDFKKSIDDKYKTKYADIVIEGIPKLSDEKLMDVFGKVTHIDRKLNNLLKNPETRNQDVREMKRFVDFMLLVIEKELSDKFIK